MTDLPYLPQRRAWVRPDVGRLRPWLPFLCLVLGAAGGLAAGYATGADTSGYEDKLVVLLRFMAGVKALGVLIAAAVTSWRLTRPVAARVAAAYCCALTLMALAPGLIWSLGAVALGALVFHAGLLAFLGFAWADRSA